jgi:hypothetical protein
VAEHVSLTLMTINLLSSDAMIPQRFAPLLLLGVLSCSPAAPAPASSARQTPAASSSPGPAQTASAEAARFPASSASPLVVPPPEALSNLLLHTDAHVTLSSRVDNPRDYPEHLVDGKPGTAWNGKTQDTHAWIEVELDVRVHVDSIQITAGFDKGELFEKNLRISKLRVTRDGHPGEPRVAVEQSRGRRSQDDKLRYDHLTPRGVRPRLRGTDGEPVLAAGPIDGDALQRALGGVQVHVAHESSVARDA